MAKTKVPASHAETIIERFSVSQSDVQADRSFYRDCVWRIADGTISEVEQAAFDLLMASNGGDYDYAADLDAARKILDWRSSGNCQAGTESFESQAAEMQRKAEAIAADLEKSKANTAKLQVEHNAAIATLNKFKTRGKHWADLSQQRPHLFAEGGQ